MTSIPILKSLEPPRDLCPRRLSLRGRRTNRRRRGVSDVLAVILLIAITVVLVVAVFVLDSALTHGPGATPIGTVFATGRPSPATRCTASGAPTVGCIAAHDYVYTLTVEQSKVSFGDVLFEVKTPSGTVYSATTEGGFNILDDQSHTVAAYNLSVTGPLAVPNAGSWVYLAGPGVTGHTPLTDLYTIVTDMGSVDPTGQGYVFVVAGTGSYSSSTVPILLP